MGLRFEVLSLRIEFCEREVKDWGETRLEELKFCCFSNKN